MEINNDDLIKIGNKLQKIDYTESQKYANSDDFIYFINEIEKKPKELKLGIIKLLELKKDEEEYYLDKFDNRISYQGMKTLKKPGTIVNWSKLAKSEFKKCSASFKYFFYNYCRIMTKKGYDFPEIRHYQKELINNINIEKRLLISYSRQKGKTVLVSSYILWKLIFGRNTTHGIAANLLSTAREVLQKITEIFFTIPFIFLPGIKVFNKGRLDFDNGTKILTAASNGNAFRGYSLIGEECDETIMPSGAVLYIDECAYISANDWQEFSDSVFPTVSSVENSHIIMSSTMKGRNHWFLEVKLAKDRKIKYLYSDIVPKLLDLNINSTVKTLYENKKQILKDYSNIILNIIKIDEKYYEIEFKHGKNNNFITEANYLDGFRDENGILNEKEAEKFKQKIIAEKGREFFNSAHANIASGSTKTLINDKFLDTLNPIRDDEIIFDLLFNDLKVYETVKPNHHYILTCDPKKDGIDSVGINVIDVTNLPFKQVATAKLLESYMIIPSRLFDLGNYYNQALVVCENNVGESIPTTLFYQYEYEGEIFTETRPNGKLKNEMGIRMTTKSKKILLGMLKNFIENNNLIINDKTTIDELYNFIEHKNGTFSAEDGSHDDMVMSLCLLFAPFMSFKNWDNFRGFIDLLEKRNKDKEIKEQETIEFLDLGFSSLDYIDEPLDNSFTF